MKFPRSTSKVWLERAMGWVASRPLVRGSLTVGAGLVLGNLIGFARVAVTAYLLGTHARADAFAVAIGPVDMLNSVLINTMLFAFVPMLMLREGAERIALFQKASRLFVAIFAALTAVLILGAPLLIRVLGPGLDHEQTYIAVNVLRITAFSTLAAGSIAIRAALMMTERRFGPAAFYQASLNTFTIAGALLFWRFLGIYGFAIGYTTGAFVQLAYTWFSVHPAARRPVSGDFSIPWRELLAKPGSFLIYAGLIALNVIVTRAHATQSGSGMAAAFDYCIRCVNVAIAYLVSPLSNSLLPEIARLRARNQSREAWRLIDRTSGLVMAAGLAACLASVMLRQPVITLLFQRGNFTADSTQLVSEVFLGFAPSLIGWSLLELFSRSLFALDRPGLPLLASAIPVLFNLVFSFWMRSHGLTAPKFIGLGASLGLLLAFAVLFTAVRWNRRNETLELVAPEQEQLIA